MFCRNCGWEQPEDARFCAQCGFEVTSGTARSDPEASKSEVFTRVSRALKDQYIIVAELGRGGMGIVFEAVEKALDREVALKVLPFDFSQDAEFVDRFHREAKLAARLRHPNIMPIFSVGQRSDVHYISMDILRGGTLFDHMQHGVPISRAIQVIKQVASALQVAHDQSLVHRDIKPENILFDSRGVAVVTDFGIAKALTGTKYTRTGIVMGTFHYMSPEQINGHVVDRRSDLYALGVMFYEMATGRVPFDGPSGPTIMYKHVHETPLPPSEVRPEVPRRISDIIMKLLEKEPADRYQSGHELISALGQIPLIENDKPIEPESHEKPKNAPPAESVAFDEAPKVDRQTPVESEAVVRQTTPPPPPRPTPPPTPIEQPSAAPPTKRKKGRVMLYLASVFAVVMAVFFLLWWIPRWQDLRREHHELRGAFQMAIANEDVAEAERIMQKLDALGADTRQENQIFVMLLTDLNVKIDELQQQYDDAMSIGDYREAARIEAILAKYGVVIEHDLKLQGLGKGKQTFGKDNPFDGNAVDWEIGKKTGKGASKKNGQFDPGITNKQGIRRMDVEANFYAAIQSEDFETARYFYDQLEDVGGASINQNRLLDELEERRRRELSADFEFAQKVGDVETMRHVLKTYETFWPLDFIVVEWQQAIDEREGGRSKGYYPGKK